MTGTLFIFTDIKYQWLGLWSLLLISSGNEWDSEHLYWPIEAMAGILDTFTDL